MLAGRWCLSLVVIRLCQTNNNNIGNDFNCAFIVLYDFSILLLRCFVIYQHNCFLPRQRFDLKFKRKHIRHIHAKRQRLRASSVETVLCGGRSGGGGGGGGDHRSLLNWNN